MLFARYNFVINKPYNFIQKFVLTWDTLVVLAFRETDHASTPRGVFIRLAIRVWTARYIVAGINTASLDARQIIFAIVVGGTFTFAGRNSRTANTVRITDHTFGTLAHVISLCVDAIRTVSARIIRAFVHIDATVLRVTFEASLAHASRRIARRTFCIYAARESIARICNDTGEITRDNFP